ncbi:MAG: hypothetical protein WBM76_07840 [Woeseiaceae bacterium]|jgi:hypothetical protein
MFISKAMTFLTAVILVLWSVAASAVPPEKITIGPTQIFGMHVADCGEFNVLWDGTVEGYIKVFFDKEGKWKKYVEFYKGVHHESMYYIDDDPDVMVSGGPVEVEKNTWYPDGTQVVVGLSSKITIPGHGVIVHNAGRIIYDLTTGEVLFQAGPGDLYVDTTPFCEFFSSLR